MAMEKESLPSGSRKYVFSKYDEEDEDDQQNSQKTLYEKSSSLYKDNVTKEPLLKFIRENVIGDMEVCSFQMHKNFNLIYIH
jgi:hypothetical protein